MGRPGAGFPLYRGAICPFNHSDCLGMSGEGSIGMTDYVVDLEELGRASVTQAGGKGALLGELLARGVPVPRGFCLTTRAYDDFLDQFETSEGGSIKAGHEEHEALEDEDIDQEQIVKQKKKG